MDLKLDNKNRVEKILKDIEALGSQENIEGMARFGIQTDHAFGVSIYVLRKYARSIEKDHQLAHDLWRSNVHEARHLAVFVEESSKVTEKQMESWTEDFNSWDICDITCSNLWDRTPFAWKYAVEWSKRKEEFVKRAGFTLMASLSVHDKDAKDHQFRAFFPIIEREATDDRNFVKKAVNWALRSIGKRNAVLNREAVKCAERIREQGSRSARWIASDALRELNSEKVQKRIAK
jgi:3-methyladenine DNA glycosylase AlkD